MNLMAQFPKLHSWLAALLAALFAGCAMAPQPKAPPAQPPAAPAPKAEQPPPPQYPALAAGRFSDLPSWSASDHGAALEAFLRSCQKLGGRGEWSESCSRAAALPLPPAPPPRGEGSGERAGARQFFETNFRPYQVLTPDGAAEGLVTGYYEPLLKGSRSRSSRYKHPVYGVPEDLLTVDLTEVQPDLRNRRVRGRLDGRRVVPYFTRAEIESGRAAVAGREILWVDDALDLFFLQVQGSGRVVLPDGKTVRLGYADHNGHPYTSIGKVLVERGELTLDKASAQGIRQWAGANPAKLSTLLNENASYVFFRELPAEAAGLGPPGALGVPLTPGYSIAVDPQFVPLGAPVYLATTMPNSAKPLNRLVLAQDTGTAIKGAVRADFFWGFGPEAGEQAGKMKQPGRLWVLLPADWVKTNGAASP